MSYLGEVEIVLAAAKAQGVIRKAAIQILRRDKHDGIRATKWLALHEEVYSHILEEAHDMLDDEQRTRAAKLSGDPEP